jgi:hypothetical protein
MQLAEEIRQFIFDNYIKPAKAKGETKVTVVSGDVHSQMRLENQMPSVCQVLRGEKFQIEYNICLMKEVRLPSVQFNSSTNRFIFDIR